MQIHEARQNRWAGGIWLLQDLWKVQSVCLVSETVGAGPGAPWSLGFWPSLPLPATVSSRLPFHSLLFVFNSYSSNDNHDRLRLWPMQFCPHQLCSLRQKKQNFLVRTSLSSHGILLHPPRWTSQCSGLILIFRCDNRHSQANSWFSSNQCSDSYVPCLVHVVSEKVLSDSWALWSKDVIQILANNS